jgi:hypothetical protein
MTTFRLRLRTSSVVTALVCTAWLSACGDGDPTTDPTGGSSGSGATGGGAGKGGSSGSSGSGAGVAGSAGTGEGGEAGVGVGGTGATGGEGAIGGEGATGGQGEAGLGGAGSGPIGGEGGMTSAGAGGVMSEGGEGGLSIGGAGGEGGAPEVCEHSECGAECVNLDVGVDDGNTVSHCGACDRACSLANASEAVCQDGECAPTCNAGFDDCVADTGIGASDDGCETELAVGNDDGDSVSDCGACGRDCSLTNATASTCASGSCVPTCTAGFGDCVPDDGDGADDGCETPIADTTNCGACGHACSTANTTATACTTGQCAPTCATGFLDCNVNGGDGPDDGCETPTDTTASCGTTCADVVDCELGASCTSGACDPIGLAVLSIPFTAAGQTQRYGAAHATSAADLTNDTVHVRLFAPGATAGFVNIYLIDAMGPAGPGTIRDLTTLNSGWVTVSIPVGPAAGEWDPTFVRQVTLDVSSGTTGPWANPTVIYVDRVWSDNGLLNDRFPDAFTPMVISSFTTVTGSTLAWTELLPP